MKEKINVLISKINEKVNSLSNIQKLFTSIVFLIIMIFITNVLFQKVLKNNQLMIDYKSSNIEDLYSVSYTFYDESDLYAQIKNIADNIIIGLNKTNSNDELTKENIYKYCLYPEYKDNISKSKYKKNVDNFLSKINVYVDSNIGCIPDSIVKYKENFYIVCYKDESDNEAYLGIMLSPEYKKFYIWYIY